MKDKQPTTQSRLSFNILVLSVTVSLASSAAAYFFRDSCPILKRLLKQMLQTSWSIFCQSSLVGTIVCVICVLVYALVSVIYHWRRAYGKIEPSQPLPKDQNEIEWEAIQQKLKTNPAIPPERILINSQDKRHFLAELRVFNYVEEAALSLIAEKSELRMVEKGELLTFANFELVIVTAGRFAVRSTTLETLQATIRKGGALTSYVNVMRGFGSFFFLNGKNAARKHFKQTPIANIQALQASQVLIIKDSILHELATVSPLAIAHLTQVILSRFKRATLPVLNDYLGMTERSNQVLLPYFVKPGNDMSSLAELQHSVLDKSAGDWRSERAIHAIFSYMLKAFDLNHSRFGVMDNTSSFLQSHIQFHAVEATERRTLQEEGREFRGAFVIIEGCLKLSFAKTGSDALLASSGDIVGVLSALMGKCSPIHIFTEATCTFALISPHLIEMMAERDPKLLFSNIPSHQITDPLIEFLDLCVDWQQRPCGSFGQFDGVIAKLIHGRLREVDDDGGNLIKGREFGAGSFIGQESLFQDDFHVVKNLAVRQTELATISKDVIQSLISLNPAVASSMLPRLLKTQQNPGAASTQKTCTDPIKTICLLPTGIDTRNQGVSSNITVNAARNRQMSLTELFAQQLEASLVRHRVQVTRIDSGRAAEIMGRQLFTTLGTLKMSEYLAALEETNRILVYVADAVLSSWTRECISQADLIMLIGDADSGVVELGDLERHLLHLNCLVSVELCLTSLSAYHGMETGAWIRNRPWVQAHHHIVIRNDPSRTNDNEPTDARDSSSPNALIYRRLGAFEDGMSTLASKFYNHDLYSSTNILLSVVPSNLWSNLLEKSNDFRQYLQRQQRRLRRRSAVLEMLWGKQGGSSASSAAKPQQLDDFGRLSRRLLGRSLGLVLGGGGAKGFAHIGVVKALKEAGIEFDLIGGTSIGAFIGGLYARAGQQSKIIAESASFAKVMANSWRHALDLTYPTTAWFSGHAFNRALWKVFEAAGIEDFPIPFFAISTDLTRSGMQIHRAGRAWQYIRASMSLAGLIPPVCDTRDGTLLVDGGYLSNVPIEVMQCGSFSQLSRLWVTPSGPNEELSLNALSAAVVIAIDIGRDTDRVPVYYGDSLSGWTVLWRKFQRTISYWLNDTSPVSVPLTLDDIQFRLAYASSQGLLSRAMQRTHAQLIAELTENPLNYLFTYDILPEFSLPSVLYLRPQQVLKFGVLDFGKHDRLLDIGYEYGKRLVLEWRHKGILDKLLALQGHYADADAKGLDKAEDRASVCQGKCPYCRDSRAPTGSADAADPSTLARRRRLSV